jgi:hypothetical protein
VTDANNNAIREIVIATRAVTTIVGRAMIPGGSADGSGFYINPTPPEDAAKYLREVKL